MAVWKSGFGFSLELSADGFDSHPNSPTLRLLDGNLIVFVIVVVTATFRLVVTSGVGNIVIFSCSIHPFGYHLNSPILRLLDGNLIVSLIVVITATFRIVVNSGAENRVAFSCPIHQMRLYKAMKQKS